MKCKNIIHTARNNEAEALHLLWKNRTPEEIDAILERIANTVVENDMEAPAILFFESIKPIAPIGARIGGGFLSGLIPLIGYSIDDLFVAFRERENVEKVLQLIEARIDEKKATQKAAREEKAITRRERKERALRRRAEQRKESRKGISD